MKYLVITNYLGYGPVIERFDNEIDLEEYYTRELEEAEADKEKIGASSIASIEVLRVETIRKTICKK